MQTITEIPLSVIHADFNFNCRGFVAPIDVTELAEDIKKHGLLQPITVKSVESARYQYKIITGHRRFKAFEVLKKETIPAIIRDDISDEEAAIINLTENIQRRELNIMQEARGVKLFREKGWSQGDLAARLSKSPTWVNIRYKLLELPEVIQEAAAAGHIRQQNILELAKLPNKEAQIDYARKVKEANLKGDRLIVKVTKKAKELYKKKARSQGEIIGMIEHILDSIGENFGTRCLAWASGGITDYELFRDIEEIAINKGLKYEFPLEKPDLSV